MKRSALSSSSLALVLAILAASCSGTSGVVGPVADGGNSDGAADDDGSTTSADDGGATADSASTGNDASVASGCAGVTATAKLSVDVQPILTASCTSSRCHGSGAQAGLRLTSGASAAALVNAASTTCTGRTRVVPRDVAQSYLVNKLTGVGMCSGGRMPEGGVLTAAQIDLVRAWICAGANND